MTVKRKEQLPSTGFTINTLVVVPTTLEFYDSSSVSIDVCLS
jgi:hypothetical protein